MVSNNVKQGGLQITNLQCWNSALLVKCLWNLSGKADNLWVQWVNYYYLKGKDIMEYEGEIHNNWMFRGILKQRENIMRMQQTWEKAMQQNHCKITNFYSVLINDGSSVPWCHMVQFNMAMPHTIVFLWMAYHGK